MAEKICHSLVCLVCLSDRRFHTVMAMLCSNNFVFLSCIMTRSQLIKQEQRNGNGGKSSALASPGASSGTGWYQPPQRKPQKAQEQAAVEGPSETGSFS